jgi:hypothetical protein
VPKLKGPPLAVNVILPPLAVKFVPSRKLMEPLLVALMLPPLTLKVSEPPPVIPVTPSALIVKEPNVEIFDEVRGLGDAGGVGDVLRAPEVIVTLLPKSTD